MDAKVLIVIFAFAICLVNANISGTNPPNGACLCVSASGLNVRGSACGGRVGGARSGQCFTYKGRNSWCSLSGRSWHFFNFNFNGRDGWAAGNYLTIGSASRCGSGPPPVGNCGRIISRAGWGARPPRRVGRMRTPVSMVFVHHTAGPFCSSRSACAATARNTQRYHMNSRGYSDVGYSFLVGEDGMAYEGRGFTTVGAHTRGYNSRAIAISVMGNFMRRTANAGAQRAIQDVIACGISRGFVRSNYELFGHRNGGCTACPGDQLYNTITRWPRFSRRRIPRYC
ncbi:unnamed protein product [Owenia fusiformis]|uniref:Uncharacterized protein n=1 Tax=Owenia fusiformis TaxID=6347 RepID=A0A8J1TCV9_OWEFU|nr:unnamed protein product [Owenia fusiformis]